MASPHPFLSLHMEKDQARRVGLLRVVQVLQEHLEEVRENGELDIPLGVQVPPVVQVLSQVVVRLGVVVLQVVRELQEHVEEKHQGGGPDVHLDADVLPVVQEPQEVVDQGQQSDNLVLRFPQVLVQREVVEQQVVPVHQGRVVEGYHRVGAEAVVLTNRTRPSAERAAAGVQDKAPVRAFPC